MGKFKFKKIEDNFVFETHGYNFHYFQEYLVEINFLTQFVSAIEAGISI